MPVNPSLKSTAHKFGVGFENIPDAFKAGKGAAEKALADGEVTEPDLILAFCDGKTDHGAFYDGIQSVAGKTAPIVGGSSAGIITRETVCYEGQPCGVAVCKFDGATIEVASAGGIYDDAKATGFALANTFGADHANTRAMLVLYDSLAKLPTPTSPPVIVPSSDLLAGITSTALRDVPIFGAGLVSDFELERPSKLFTGDEREARQVATGLLFKGDLEIDSAIMHGCTPKDGIYHTVTRSEGACIFEVDDRPVVQLINEMYGNEDWRKKAPIRRLSLGINYGEKFGEIHESNFVNRLIAGVLPGDAGIVLFESDLTEGSEFLFMLRDPEHIIKSAAENGAKLIQKAIDQGRSPLFGLYIDCAGRAAAISDMLTEEAAEVAAVFERHEVPLLGFYTGVEIAPMLGESRGLDWTGVLMLFTG